jgi:hypothetical protein
MLHTIFYGQVWKNRLIIFGTATSLCMFFMDICFLEGWGYIPTTLLLNVFAILAIHCILLIVENWVIVPFSLSTSNHDSIHRLTRLLFGFFNGIWWIPLTTCWILGMVYDQDNLLIAGGLLSAGLASTIATMIIFYIFRKMKFFIKTAMENARDAHIVNNDLAKAIIRIDRYGWSMTLMNGLGGVFCMIAAAVIINQGTIYVFYYFHMYVLHPFIWGLFLPIIYIHLALAKKTRLSSDTRNEPLYPGRGVHSNEKNGSHTLSEEMPVAVIRLSNEHAVTDTRDGRISSGKIETK